MTWESLPLGVFFRRVEERYRADLPLLSVYRDLGVVPREEWEEGRNRPSDDLTNYKVVRRGDLVLNKMKTWQGSLAISDYEGIVSPAYFVGRPERDFHQRFLHHLLRSAPLIAEYGARSKGIRPAQWDLAWDKFKTIRVAIPPMEQQKGIADYLDRETDSIDALITKKQRLLELYAQRLRVQTIELTRRGLDPAASMAESGLPWIGPIPTHWSVVRNKDVMAIRKRVVGEQSQTTRLLSLTTQGVIPRDVTDNYGKFPASFDTYQHIRSEDLVFCLFDVPETPRTVGLSDESGMVTGAYTVCEPVSGVSSAYLQYLYLGIDYEKSLSLFYTGLRNVIRPGAFMAMKCPLPPLDEQIRIVEHLRLATRWESQVSAAQSALIGLLRERRRALIAAAVTGELEIAA